MGRKKTAIEMLEYTDTKYGPNDGIDNDRDTESAISELVESFHSINKMISEHANLMLITLNKSLVERGYTEKEVLDMVNANFTEECRYKSLKEVIDHHRNIAI